MRNITVVIAIAIAIAVAVTVFFSFQKVEHLRLATKDDMRQAVLAAQEAVCIKHNNAFKIGGNGSSYDCHYTKDTCNANSAWPELTAAESPTKVAQLYQFWNEADGKCYMGYGGLRKACEAEGLQWNEQEQECRVTKGYCTSKLLGWKNNDCFESVMAEIDTTVLGTTLGRAFAYATPIGQLANLAGV